MSTVVIEDQPEPAPRIKRTTTVVEEVTPPPSDTVINVGEGTTVVVEDED